MGSIDEEYFTARPAAEPLKIVTQEIEVVDRKYQAKNQMLFSSAKQE